MRRSFKRETKNKTQAGITLIALVITIIVLIILAMVTIAMLTGPNGLLNKSVEAKIENAHGEVRERLELETNAYLAEKLEGTYNGTLLDYFKEKGFVKEDGETIDVTKLTDSTQTLTGNEKEVGKDVYKIEEKEVSTGNITKLASTELVKIAASGDSNVKEYSINYYDESGNKKEIGLLVDNLELANTEKKENEIKVDITFKYRDFQKNEEASEVKSVIIPQGETTAIIKPPLITEQTVDDKTYKPRGWSTDSSLGAQIEVNVGDDITVTKDDNGKTYYMSYTYTKPIPFVDPNENKSKIDNQEPKV